MDGHKVETAVSYRFVGRFIAVFIAFVVSL
jgi:hypothetical protein